MQEFEPGGPCILPPQLCSDKRIEFFRRGNVILGFYTTVALYAEQGRKALEGAEKSGKLTDATSIRARHPSGGVSQINFGLLRKQFTKAGAQLTNQVLLMVYGNFEAFLSDCVSDGLVASGGANPDEDTIRLMMSSRWQGKIDRIAQTLGVQLGRRALGNQFRDVDMGFLGDKCAHPIDFLDKMADLRHRLVHSVGRADAAFVEKYPNAGLAVGDTIALPFGLPNQIHLFFVLLTEVIDKAFASKFGWPRSVVAVEKLTENNEPEVNAP